MGYVQLCRYFVLILFIELKWQVPVMSSTIGKIIEPCIKNVLFLSACLR